MIFYSMTDFSLKASAQHKAAHTLLSETLRKVYGINEYSLRYGEHGKPFLNEYPEIFFNLSHCRGLIVCGLSDNNEIGVDAELIRPYNGSAAKRVFSEAEKKLVSDSGSPSEMFFRIWTLKESLGKALGTGIFSYSGKYEFSFEDGMPVCKECPRKVFTQKIIGGKWVVSTCSEVRENSFTHIVLQ